MEKLDKKTYRGIVKFTLESMLNLSKTDKNYNLAADTIYYDVGVKTINKFNPIPYSTLKNSYFVVYRRGLGNI